MNQQQKEDFLADLERREVNRYLTRNCPDLKYGYSPVRASWRKYKGNLLSLKNNNKDSYELH